MNSTSEEIDKLRELLRRLAAADPGLRVFGASAHRYRLRPPLAEAELVAFERQYGVRLPPDYRRFLAAVGGGGAGPHYGLSALSSMGNCVRPDRAFPWTKAAFVSDPAALGLSADQVEPAGASDADRDTLPEGVPGSVHLSEEGCGYYVFLVVNGPAYGHVWSDWTAADCGLVPTGLTFAAWYRQWIDRCLARLARERLVDRVRVGMDRAALLDLLGSDFVERETRSARTDGRESTIGYRDAAVTIFLAEGLVSRIVRHNI